MTDGGQGLLKRNSNFTRVQFSEHWLKHGAKVIPWALENGISYYAQIHNPRIAPGIKAPPDVDITEWDGAAEMIIERQPGFEPSKKSNDYYQRIILPDERAFLISEALHHIKRVDGGTVTGERIVVIEDGKAVLHCAEETQIWENWETQL